MHNNDSIKIKQASITDDFCNYTYEITEGVGLGDTHSVKGKGIIMDDLKNAFAKLNAHLALVDEADKRKAKNFEEAEAAGYVESYDVSAITIKGGEGSESISLSGTKYVHGVGGRIDMKTPQIYVGEGATYKWYNELQSAAYKVCREVIEYANGKYTRVEDLESEEEKRQLKMDLEAAGKTKEAGATA